MNYLAKRGVLILFLFFASIKLIVGQSPLPEKLEILPYPDTPLLTDRVKRSQKILKALFLEQRYQFTEAQRIWKTMPRTNLQVQDHIFQSELIVKRSLDTDTIPATPLSIKTAVLFLRWQKRWSEAYELLQEQSELVSNNIELQYIKAIFALYLRKYEDTQRQLKTIASNEFHDKEQLGLLGSWLYLLSGKQLQLQQALKQLEENAMYYPTVFMMSEYAGYSMHEIHENAMSALVRFPSNRELIENIVISLQHHEAFNELQDVLDHGISDNELRVAWMTRAEVYLQTHEFKKLKVLLTELQSSEEVRVEFLNYRAQVAIYEQDWPTLKAIAHAYHNRFPYLKDGDYFMAIYEDSTRQSQ